MTEHHVKISGGGLSHVIEINGHPVQNMTESLDLSIRGGHAPVLTLRLTHKRGGPDVETRAVVRLDQETTEALKAMGWTPPEAG